MPNNAAVLISTILLPRTAISSTLCITLRIALVIDYAYMLRTLSTLVVLFALATLTAFAKTPDGWKEFVSPAQDFRVLMPAKLHEKYENFMGQTTKIYQQIDDGKVAYALADGIYVDKDKKPASHDNITQQIISAAEAKFTSKEDKQVSKDITPVKGKGWHGKRVVFKTSERVVLTLLVAIADTDDVVYNLYANAGEDKPNVAEFFKSFEVEPKRATASHLDQTRSPAVHGFVNVVWTISLAALGLAAVAIIVSIIRNHGKPD